MRLYVAMETPITNNLNGFQSFGQKSVSDVFGSYKQNMPAPRLDETISSAFYTIGSISGKIGQMD